MNIYQNRYYIIFNIAELSAINFEEVLETSADTISRSVDNTKGIVKWENEMPECIQNLTTKEGPYTHSEILEILNTEEWFVSSPIIIS
jgi:hypothetical protein